MLNLLLNVAFNHQSKLRGLRARRIELQEQKCDNDLTVVGISFSFFNQSRYSLSNEQLITEVLFK